MTLTVSSSRLPFRPADAVDAADHKSIVSHQSKGDTQSFRTAEEMQTNGNPLPQQDEGCAQSSQTFDEAELGDLSMSRQESYQGDAFLSSVNNNTETLAFVQGSWPSGMGQVNYDAFDDDGRMKYSNLDIGIDGLHQHNQILHSPSVPPPSVMSGSWGAQKPHQSVDMPVLPSRRVPSSQRVSRSVQSNVGGSAVYRCQCGLVKKRKCDLKYVPDFCFYCNCSG